MERLRANSVSISSSVRRPRTGANSSNRFLGSPGLASGAAGGVCWSSEPERFLKQLVDIMEPAAPRVAFDQGFGFGFGDLDGHGRLLPFQRVPPFTLPPRAGPVPTIECDKGRFHTQCTPIEPSGKVGVDVTPDYGKPQI